jgi:hypothetical protein
MIIYMYFRFALLFFLSNHRAGINDRVQCSLQGAHKTLEPLGPNFYTLTTVLNELPLTRSYGRIFI